MKTIPKWLLIPPVVAALIILGPLSMQSASTPASNEPDLWPMTALVGVVLLGVVLLGTGGLPRLRLRGQTQTPGARLATLRQTLRLSAQQAVHVIEFDNRILLVAEYDRGLVLLETGRVQAGVDVAPARHAALPATASSAEEHDEGAVPKNLVLPRPQTMPRRRPSPSPAIVPAARTGPGLNDFRALLQKAGRT